MTQMRWGRVDGQAGSRAGSAQKGTQTTQRGLYMHYVYWRLFIYRHDGKGLWPGGWACASARALRPRGRPRGKRKKDEHD